jgi:hypothetical protein
MSPIIEKVVKEIESRQFFGTLEIKFEAGLCRFNSEKPNTQTHELSE